MVMLSGSWSNSEVLSGEKHAGTSLFYLSFFFNIVPRTSHLPTPLSPQSHPGRSKRVPGDEVDSFSFQEAKCNSKDKTLVKALLSKSKFNKYTCVQQTLSRSQKGLTLSMKARDILLKRAIIVFLNNLLYQK